MQLFRFLTCLSLALTGLVGLAIPASCEEVTLATYHQEPPFIVDQNARIGLTYELAQYLEAASQSEFRFKVDVLPRKRLDALLSQNSQVVVPWVNPAWFGDDAKEKHRWTVPILEDSNAVISSALRPVDYAGPENLKGRRIAGVLGHRFVGIDPLVDSGDILRDDVTNFWSAMKMVSVGRVDATIVPAAIAKYFIASNNMAGIFHFSIRPHSSYSRHFLVQHNDRVYAFLSDQADALTQGGLWQAIMARYGM